VLKGKLVDVKPIFIYLFTSTPSRLASFSLSLSFTFFFSLYSGSTSSFRMSKPSALMHSSNTKLNAAGMTPDNSMNLPERQAELDEVVIMQAVKEVNLLRCNV